MAEKIAMRAPDGTVLLLIHREPGRDRFQFMPAFFEQVTQEEWQRFRKSICEQLGYPEEDIIAQEKEWAAQWCK